MTGTFVQKLEQYYRAAYPYLWSQTFEEQRVFDEIKGSQFTRNLHIYTWDTTFGYKHYSPVDDKGQRKEETKAKTNSLQLMMGNLWEFLQVNKHPEHDKGVLVILKDLHPYLKEPGLIRDLRSLADVIKVAPIKMLVLFASPLQSVPVELSKLFQFLDYELPNEEQLGQILDYIVRSMERSKSSKIQIADSYRKKAIEAARGMTSIEAENAFALGAITDNTFTDVFCHTVFDEKIERLKNTSHLTYMPSDVSFANVGGLEGIKKWVCVRSKGLVPEARAFGLPNNKGIILAGVPGTGKSLIAKAISAEFKVPLFQFDMGSMFSRYVGDTESNIRLVIKTIEAIGPCVVYIDEIEKSMSRDATSGKSDSGTSSRVFGSFLTWLSDRTSPAFVVATSNNYLSLPPELIRRGRFDEMFWIDLPNRAERADIIKVLLTKYKRSHEQFKIEELINATDGYTGAEIEQAILSAMFTRFAADSGKKDINTKDLLHELGEIEPLSKVNAEDYQRMVQAASGKLRMASKVNEDEALTNAFRKLAL